MAEGYESEKDMSKSQTLQNHATDSQILGPLDSISLPSEPPDIRNLFSSYTYESPDLNTLDGFQDFTGAGETPLKEVKKAESGENQSVGTCDDGLLSAAKQSLNGIVNCNDSDEFEYSKYAAMVTGSSESLSLVSEPPDIKNWFSSYSYESPVLDTTDDITISDYKEWEDGKVSIAEQNNKDVRDFIDIEENADLPSQTRITAVIVKCTNSLKESLCNDDKIDVKLKSSTLSQSTSSSGSEQVLVGQGIKNHNHGSVEKFRNTNTDGKDYDAKLDSSLIDITNHTGSRDAESPHKMKDLVKDSQEKEDLHKIISAGTIDLTVKGNYWRRPTDRSIGKENEEIELLGNGFIAIRKKSRDENAENVTKRIGVQSQNGVNRGKDANVRRELLSETSNFRSSKGNIVEITGKWRCPQKNKPNLGPPLKQLRLEQWVRRV
ncbi:hypothetical protein BUALT_Bualt10G0019600 [Buddleja alternifolia]|uniref:Uncharacterized protein n=1 Tax=Buddleja alternifolia TaxID=168488 RepID=A0AAV6X646_9LAMI|nr:hypothetical protein BUALT_Bualt10G0019600 [Buddleja alternifolia]